VLGTIRLLLKSFDEEVVAEKNEEEGRIFFRGGKGG
jgi:hypothetical protein